MPRTQKNRALRTIAWTLVAVIALCGAAVIIVAYSGAVDVAATNHPSAFTRWFLETTRDHSVARRAKGIEVPDLNDPAMLAMGADHYQEMCVTCHGAPGVEPSETGQGLEPHAPHIYRGRPMSKESAAENFWIIKNGIQMTGMPAFGKTHDDAKIWAIVAFVNRLRGMTPAEYEKLAASTEHDEADDQP